MSTKGELRICDQGHKFYKSSDCPTCPICESEKKSKAAFMSKIGAPARRALEAEGILSVERLSEYSEKEILSLHGLGPSAIPRLKKELDQLGLEFNRSNIK